MSNYNFICTNCGSEWQEDSDRIKVCPECGSLDIVIQYEDINKKRFAEIQDNAKNNKRYDWYCTDCGAKKSLYGKYKTIYNVACYNGCDKVMIEIPEDIIGKLKAQRKRHRMSQDEAAKMFNVSRPIYAKIETGEYKLTADLIYKINDFLLKK